MCIITGGTAIVAAAVFFFMLPSHVSVGSGAALAMVLSNFIPLSVSTITLIMNVGLLIIGVLLVGREFGIKTIYCSILMPVIMGIYERIFPGFQSITQDPLVVVAKILNKYLRIDLGKAMSYSGIAVALSSALCYDSKTVVLSLLGTYFGGMIVDNFIFGINIKRRVCVISPKLDQIVDYVLHTLHSGATLNEIIGAYDKTPRLEMVAIVDKNEYRLLMDYVHNVDPKAFVTVYSVSDMRYQPKKK